MQMIETQLLDRLGIGSKVKVLYYWLKITPATCHQIPSRINDGQIEIFVV